MNLMHNSLDKSFPERMSTNLSNIYAWNKYKKISSEFTHNRFTANGCKWHTALANFILTNDVVIL